jgi:polyisoprenoid-binding protein YceI
MKNYLLLAFLISSCAANGQNWTPTTGQVSFKIKMLGVSVEGSFQGIKSNIQFSNNEPASIYASVDSKSINTNNSLRDKHLREKEDFFQVAEFPVIQMSSVSIQKSGENRYSGTFKITIKQMSKTLKIPFTFTEQDGKGQLKSSFEINRTDWNLGGNTPGMSDKVLVFISLNLLKK